MSGPAFALPVGAWVPLSPVRAAPPRAAPCPHDRAWLGPAQAGRAARSSLGGLAQSTAAKLEDKLGGVSTLHHDEGLQGISTTAPQRAAFIAPPSFYNEEGGPGRHRLLSRRQPAPPTP